MEYRLNNTRKQSEEMIVKVVGEKEDLFGLRKTKQLHIKTRQMDPVSLSRWIFEEDRHPYLTLGEEVMVRVPYTEKNNGYSKRIYDWNSMNRILG